MMVASGTTMMYSVMDTVRWKDVEATNRCLPKPVTNWWWCAPPASTAHAWLVTSYDTAIFYHFAANVLAAKHVLLCYEH